MNQKTKTMLGAVLVVAVAAAVLTFLAQGPASVAPWLLVAVAVAIPFLLERLSAQA